MKNQKKLIDADALLDFALNRYNKTLIPSDIVSFPTVDAVEVAEYDAVVYKLECLLCHATGGKYSKAGYSWEDMERMVTDYIEECCREAADYIAHGVTVQEWISVKDRLPESGVHILASVKMDGLYCSGHYVCDAFYAAKYTQSISGYSDECACVYCEEDDEYYLEEGWYEVIKNWDDYNSIVISDTVTHWMPLPQPPKGE